MERMVSALVRALDPDQFELKVLCLNRLGEVTEEIVGAGIPVEQFRGRPGVRRYIAFWPLAEQVRDWHPHVVHTHNPSGLFFGAPAARIAGVRRIIHTEHGRSFPDAARYMIAERVLSPLLTKYVCVSEQTKQDVAKFERIADSLLTVIPNGVPTPPTADAQKLASLRAELDIPPGVPVIGSVGRLVWEKDYANLLQAFAEVRAERGDCRLVLVGDGPERVTLEKLARDLMLAPSVQFVGRRADVGEWHQLFDVFAMSSVSEGLPLALLEAMAVRKPIVATRVGGIPLALNEGKAGVLVQPRNPQALARGVLKLLGNTERASALGHLAYLRYRESYDLAAMTAAYSRLYRDHRATHHTQDTNSIRYRRHR
jgi:glycosyltransferase involved in cell wall biosynthesis